MLANKVQEMERRTVQRPFGYAKNKLEPSAGYVWHRDFDSTDDETIWDRLGSVFLDRRWSSSNKSVSSGDYCIHGECD